MTMQSKYSKVNYGRLNHHILFKFLVMTFILMRFTYLKLCVNQSKGLSVMPPFTLLCKMYSPVMCANYIKASIYYPQLFLKF